LYETLAESSPSIKFGVAFNEASGDCLVRSEGNDEGLKKECEKIALQVGAGHFFVILIKNAFPINILNRVKNTSEVCNVLCATANPVQFITAETNQGKSVLGVVDGFKPKGVENEKQKTERRELMKKFNYKL
ncbi:MAG: adenosine-specific kinase, partial [Candidatus Marsarchaeota archaeon]|nr:adenosine-specific kinase [Candidatus Marsarchaeota archaeon]